jgi:uncharacterized membrane protein YfcA
MGQQEAIGLSNRKGDISCVPASFGIFMVGLPMAGFIAGIFLFSVKKLRFLAPFAFVIPVSSSYAAVFSFFGAIIVLERVGIADQTSFLIALICTFLGGLLGAWLAYSLVALIISRRKHWAERRI